MSETNWTPGPWKVDEEARVGGYRIEATPSAYTYVTVAVSIQNEGCAYTISFAEARNNACLIAAAPELYEALDKAHAFLGDMHALPVHWTIEKSIELHKKLPDVLAKARGES